MGRDHGHPYILSTTVLSDICTCTVCTYEYELKYVCPQEQQLSVVPSMEEEVVQYKCRMLSVQALNQDSLNAHTQTHLTETTRGMWLCTASPGQQQVYLHDCT